MRFDVHTLRSWLVGIATLAIQPAGVADAQEPARPEPVAPPSSPPPDPATAPAPPTSNSPFTGQQAPLPPEATSAAPTPDSDSVPVYPPGSPPPAYPGAPVYPPPPAYPPPIYPAPGGYPPDPRPKYLPYREGEPAPQGYAFDEEVRRGPVIGGLITLGVPYLLGLLVASEESYNNKKGYLVVPGVGPWLTLLLRDSSCDPDLAISSCTEDSSARFVLVIDGLLQTAGGIFVAYGFTNTKKRYVREDWAPRVAVTPMLSADRVGVSVTGAF